MQDAPCTCSTVQYYSCGTDDLCLTRDSQLTQGLIVFETKVEFTKILTTKIKLLSIVILASWWQSWGRERYSSPDGSVCCVKIIFSTLSSLESELTAPHSSLVFHWSNSFFFSVVKPRSNRVHNYNPKVQRWTVAKVQNT